MAEAEWTLQQWNAFHKVCRGCEHHNMKHGFNGICQLLFDEKYEEHRRKVIYRQAKAIDWNWREVLLIANPLAKEFKTPEKCPYILERAVTE